MSKSESIFIKCDCGCGVLEINVDDFEKDHIQFNFASWVERSSNNVMPKKERTRWCEYVMKTGKPWADHTIVNVKDAQRIVDFLTKQITKYGKKKQNRKYNRIGNSYSDNKHY